ncbi:ATP-binding domain-containing protein [Streptomyces olivaceus]|uniref:ATP-binding domain-containing protein n=1 Tax=Streptomyces olivaceus TaxID=47716 RepID=A0ABS7W3Q3_STROV|nr:helix-hairpin-helix domain-containing protein [Streptomyces olivaceus]MBZ6090087.1 ATP-binding domain-containing protein [Streptomyces olivaceus]MBZ6096263.1 ATP-binding domain-containing protein [Streptomyces olivaceus]MBZ6117341.1 ATP-binding domain-containing protein [Streptomyces olivaceus]MBZ6152587.1 ATP-binding domain-containing protein [Streptomyces olivaceus]MBZ6194581.1 ATP-binding domain-containing protein [Streptomyces olivaceus]
MSTEPEAAAEETADAVGPGPGAPGTTDGPDAAHNGAETTTARDGAETAARSGAPSGPTGGTTAAPGDSAATEAGGGASAEEAGTGEATTDRTDTGTGTGTDAPDGSPAAAGEKSEAEAELAAQRVERERIERRKAERQGPVDAGAKLSGTAADLLAAVRAVESGEKPAAPVFGSPEPARRPAPEPARQPRPAAPAEPAAAPGGPAPETVQAVRRVLAEGGAPETLAPQTAALLGEGAEGALRADPWQLLRVTGVRPEQADGFARALLGAGCGPDDERRGRAVTVWLLEQAALAGHTALELPRLTETLARRGVPDPDAAVQSTLAEGEALAFQDALEEPGGRAESASRGTQDTGEEGAGDGEERPVRVLVGLERYALAEESLADGLARLVNSAPKQDGSAADWEQAAAAARGSAAELIRAVAGHGLVLHTGGEASLAEPAALLRTARALGLRAWAAAHGPLGRDRFAALLDTSSEPAEPSSAEPARTGPAAVALAGLLSGAEGPGRDAEGTLDLDLLVVLDAPQLDVESAALLAESLPDGARLVLAGDPAVLWSAGPGRVFADLLAARVCPQVASRRPDPGPLGELVSGIGIGELGQVEAPGKEVVIVPVREAAEAVHRTVQLVADSVPRAIGVPAEDTQVITPGHGGAAGTRALNAALKERLNPGPGRFGGFDPGDRVAYSPAPGRTLPGRVTKAEADGLHLACAGETVVVPRDRVEQSVRHGWALTAHQAVGGRWPAVVVVLPGDAAQSLSRPWVYTAFGRAARHLSVVHGVEQALPRAVAEVPAKPRTTRLPVLLAPQVPTDA